MRDRPNDKKLTPDDVANKRCSSIGPGGRRCTLPADHGGTHEAEYSNSAADRFIRDIPPESSEDG